MNIGVIDCGTNSRLCEEIGYNDKLVYFKGDVGPERGEVSFIVALLIKFNNRVAPRRYPRAPLLPVSS